VKTNGSTSVQVAQNGALSDLTPGAQVTVEGAAGSDGTVTATKVIKAR
jgi:cytochrome c-type biogenesis protein CcmE